jgi:hypothetical protein
LKISVETMEMESGDQGAWAKGHHEPREFLRAVKRANPDWGINLETDIECVFHAWWVEKPDPEGDKGDVCWADAQANTPGAFGVTILCL